MCKKLKVLNNLNAVQTEMLEKSETSVVICGRAEYHVYCLLPSSGRNVL